jgi:uncharacterized protein YbjT (DUF2867 family)
VTRARGRPALSRRRAHRGQRRWQAADTPQSAGLIAQSAQRNRRGRTQQGNEDNGHEGATYTLTGPAFITHTEIAAALTFALGRDTTFTDIPSGALAENLQGILPPWRILGLLENYAHYRRRSFPGSRRAHRQARQRCQPVRARLRQRVHQLKPSSVSRQNHWPAAQ